MSQPACDQWFNLLVPNRQAGEIFSRRPAARSRSPEGDFAAHLRFSLRDRGNAARSSLAVRRREKQTFRPKIGPGFAVEDKFRTAYYEGVEAILALEDGTIFRGVSFGAPRTQAGEICFNTAMTGYQEVLTDPSLPGPDRGHDLSVDRVTAAPIPGRGERCSSGSRGFVIEELSPVPSSWRSSGDLDGFLRRGGVPGIHGIDTRALTRRLRSSGIMRACIAMEGLTDEQAIKLAKEVPYEGWILFRK